MKIITNEKLVRRNARIGQVATIASLAILGVGMYISITAQDPNLISMIWGALILGLLLQQLGLYYGNRWGRHPRQDEALDAALKGMDDRFTFYHYHPQLRGVSHLLLGPAGMWIVLPYHQRGKIVYEKNRWRQKGGGCLQSYLRIFAQEGLGRPDVDIEAETTALNIFLKKKFPETEFPTIQPVMVFMNETVEIVAEDAPNPALLAKDLKEFIRKSAKASALSPQRQKEIEEALGS